MSKTIKTTCQHKMTRGSKAGKKCGKGCRGKFCNDHKPKKIKYINNYNANYYRKIKKIAIDEKLKKFKDGNGDLPNLRKEKKKLNKIICDICVLSYDIFACRYALDPALKIPYKPMLVRKLKSQEFHDEIMKKYDKYLEKIFQKDDIDTFITKYKFYYVHQHPDLIEDMGKYEQEYKDYCSTDGKHIGILCYCERKRRDYIYGQKHSYFTKEYEKYLKKLIKPMDKETYFEINKQKYIDDLSVTEIYIPFKPFICTRDEANNKLTKLKKEHVILYKKYEDQKYLVVEYEKILNEDKN